MVTPIAGNQGDIGIALQSAQGAAAAAAQYRLYAAAGWINAAKDTQPVQETSRQRLLSTSYTSQIRAEGAPGFWARAQALGLLLYGVMGAKAVTGVGDPYTHTMTLASILPYFTVWANLGPLSGGRYEKFVDCKISQLVVASAAGGLVQVTPTFLGLVPKHMAAAEVSVAVEDEAEIFAHADGQGAFLVDGSADVTVEASTWTINNNAALLQGDAIEGYAVSEQLLGIQIATTQLVKDFDLYREFMYGDAAPADGSDAVRDILELASGLDFKYTLPGGAPERSLELIAPRVQVVPELIVPNIDGSALKYGITYNAYQPSGGGSGLTAKLLNGVASYPAAA